MGKIMPIRPDADPDRPDPDRHGSGCRSDSGSGSGKMMPIRADPDPDPDPQHWENGAQVYQILCTFHFLKEHLQTFPTIKFVGNRSQSIKSFIKVVGTVPIISSPLHFYFLKGYLRNLIGKKVY